MKQMKAQLKSISKSLVSLSKKVEGLSKQVDKRQPTKKAAPKKAAAKRKAVAKRPKVVAKKKVAIKKAPAKKSTTVLDSVHNVIKRSSAGVTIATLKAKTKLDSRQLSNALYKLTKKGLVQAKSRGVYVKK